MTLRALALVGALVIGSGLIAPGAAEARHRHDRGCGHRRADGYYYDRAPRYYGHYDDRYSRGDYYRRGWYGRRHYDDYGYSRRSYGRPRVYVHYHGRQRCSRSHGSFYFGW
jgi:hypothetical protein